MIATESITTSTTAALVATGVAEGKVVCLRDASQDTYIGGAGVTTANGFKITATSDVFSITLYQGDALYAIAGGAGTIRALATRCNTSTNVE